MKEINVEVNKVELWASTKAEVVNAANAAVEALAKAYKLIFDRFGKSVDVEITVKKGRTVCEILPAFARLNYGNPSIGFAIDSDTERQPWRFTVDEWQVLATELREYASVERCYQILAARMKETKAIDANANGEAWASTKAAVIEVAKAAANALADAHRMLVDRCGQQVDSTIEVKVGRVACDICEGYARLDGLVASQDILRQPWRFTVDEWQALATELQQYASVERCYQILAARL